MISYLNLCERKRKMQSLRTIESENGILEREDRRKTKWQRQTERAIREEGERGARE